MLNVDFLKAEHGDCIHISFNDDEDHLRHILIDGGPSSTYFSSSRRQRLGDGPLKALVDSLEQIDLLVITHIDDDHIGGVLKWFSKDKQVASKVREVWFNSPNQIKSHLKSQTVVNDDTLVRVSDGTETSTGQGKSLEEFLINSAIPHKGCITNGYCASFYGLDFSVLTPFTDTLNELIDLWVTEQPDLDTATNPDYSLSIKQLLEQDSFVEDKKVQNLSSISFVITHKERKYLFLGDAGPSDVIKALNLLGYNISQKLNVEFIKLSHHGSKKSTSRELLSIVETSKYVVSTNGKYHGHPDKACLARIIEANNSANIYFNYPDRIDTIFSDADKFDYPLFSTYSTADI